MSNNSAMQVGPGFPTLLFITFLVLKLCHVIDWSWWFVTAPLWVPIGLFLAVLLIVVIIWSLAMVIAAIWNNT
jgi:hypothetical protein